MREMHEFAPADDVVEKIARMASETTGRPADAASISQGQNRRTRNRPGVFDAAAYQRAKAANRQAKRPLPGDSPAWFDPQLPVS
tara:strand:- start:356 stop:607 length:252 start_codon:yes stop_codon:yes gene_type:complete